jgi:hypothetical protein
MATTMEAIRAKLAQQEAKSTASSNTTVDTQVFPHWNIPEGSQSRLRFLPDADSKNDFFWVERQMIRLNFPGIKGQPESKGVMVQVPCVEMWGESCPVHAELRGWYKDESMKDTANKYWKKRSYLFQGFVRENTLEDDKTPENPIRRFIISPQIFKLIKDALMDPEMENLPTDFESGLDFVVKKTSKGEYADYGTSSWARKESALTSEELNAIEQYGLFNLADFLPKKPNAEELNIIYQMFEDSVNSKLYDPEKYGNYYKPAGMMNDSSSSSALSAPKLSVVKEVSSSQDDEDEDSSPVVTQPEAKASSQRAEDILAMIRNRQK